MEFPRPAYRRVLLKLSGEALAGARGTGLDFQIMSSVCAAVKECLSLGVEVGIVVGAGNFWRGAKDGGGHMERTRADYMGMLATVMNCLALSDVFDQQGVDARVQTALSIQAAAEPYSPRTANAHLQKGRVVLLGCGTGSPFFSTDTGAVLRAVELHADVILLAKNVDGVYSADPKKDPTATRFDSLGYDEVLARRLAVMDSTATSLAMDNEIPVMVFALSDPQNIVRAVCGEKIGTLIQ
ncbi:MAG: UMP kinase [Clostridia bacterium]|nr:UMP kinase [Clostridia bacterium]MDO4749815.1 UMP kinase [Eubacteriales bacterium]